MSTNPLKYACIVLKANHLLLCLKSFIWSLEDLAIASDVWSQQPSVGCPAAYLALYFIMCEHIVKGRLVLLFIWITYFSQYHFIFFSGILVRLESMDLLYRLIHSEWVWNQYECIFQHCCVSCWHRWSDIKLAPRSSALVFFPIN